MKTKYCLGFLFSLTGGEPIVALITKNRPEWQRGKLNGIGGHVEAGELPSVAMRREFNEETGVDIAEWTPFAQLVYPEAEIFCFAAQDDDKIFEVHSMTDEKVGIYKTTYLDSWSGLQNLKWLIPMAMVKLSDADAFNRLCDRRATDIYRIEPI